MDTESTNPVEGDDTAAATVADDTGVGAEGQTSTDEIQYDDEGNEIAPPEDEEEVELDDLKLKVPKDAAQKLKDAFLRQADYTRKTQEVADMRKAVETERATLHQSSAAEISALATVQAIDQQINHYQRIDWDAYEQQNPFEAQTEWRKFQQLQNGRQEALGHYSQLSQQRTLQQQQETAKRMEEGRVVLARDIKDWSPQLAETLLDHGVKNYGFTRAEIEEFSDPRMVKVLHDAWEGRQAKAKQTQAQRHVTAQAVEPAARPSTARSGPPAGLDDRTDVKTWMERRNTQVRKRA